MAPILKVQSLVQRTKTLLKPNSHNESESGFKTAKTETSLFPATSPEIDGEDCLHDCNTCTVHLPRKWSIDESDKLYGHVKGWDTHLIVGTGKTDWVRDVQDEKGSIMQAAGKVGLHQKNGKVMLSASNMPTGQEYTENDEGGYTCLLLPAWTVIEQVKPQDVPDLMKGVVSQSVTNTTPVRSLIETHATDSQDVNGNEHANDKIQSNGIVKVKSNTSTDLDRSRSKDTNGSLHPASRVSSAISTKFTTRPCPHRALILLCSHKTRDARCGQSAPLIRKEFERHLRPLGLYRDLQDERPGGVGIYFINHVGGHKYSANCMIYRREGRRKDGTDEETDGAPLNSEAVQGIWLARVRPEDCENIIKYTVLQERLSSPKNN